MNDPLALAELVAHGVGDDETQGWLAAGLKRWLQAGGAVTLQRALGLPTTPAGLRRAWRDRWLGEAVKLLPAGLTTWEASKTLHAEATRYAGRKWPRLRHLSVPPVDLTPVEVAIHYALATGCRLPATPQGWRSIVNKSGRETSPLIAHDYEIAPRQEGHHERHRSKASRADVGPGRAAG